MQTLGRSVIQAIAAQFLQAGSWSLPLTPQDAAQLSTPRNRVCDYRYKFLILLMERLRTATVP
jgi:hypothetical protein